MFRFNNPDTLLTLLITLAAYAVTRALETAAARWMVGAGILLGLGFLTKTLQVLLVVPGFALVYLVAAPTTLGKRVAHLLAAGLAMVVAGGWWIAIVQLVPKAAPALHRRLADQLGVGADLGLQRPRPAERPGDRQRHRTPRGSGWGPTGVLRMFSDADRRAGELAAAGGARSGLAVGLWLTRRPPRTDRLRAALLLWGGWLLVTGLDLQPDGRHLPSLLHGRPGAGDRRADRHRGHAALGSDGTSPGPRYLAAAAVVATAAWAWVLLDRSPHWLPFLRWVIVAAGLLAARRHAGTPPSRPPLHHRGAGRRVRRTARRTGRLRHPHRIRPAHRRHSQRRAHAPDARAARAARTGACDRGPAPRSAPPRTGPGGLFRGSPRAQHEEHGHR